MADKMKVGVIGVGGIANLHMPGWKDNAYAEVVAGCDVAEPALLKWSEKYGIDKITTSSADLFNDPTIDIIDICTPNNYHAPLAIAAMKAGKHVLCEKPLAPSPQQIRDMIAARDESGKMLMTAQHFRFTPEAKAMKAEIDTGILGEIYHARSWMLRRAAAPTRPGFILKEHATGGATIDIGVHILDLTLWFMGNPKPISVSGVARSDLAHKPGAFSIWGGAIPPEINVEEFATAFIRFENTATLILEVSWLLHHETEGEDMQMWLYGSEGGSHWPKGMIYQTDYVAQKHNNRAIAQATGLVEAHAQECLEFSRAIYEGKPSPVPAEQSLQVLTILDAIYKSQEIGGEVKLT
jgi:predicted dehydrogenase